MPRAATSARRGFWLLYGLILTAAAALRLVQIGKLELWLDEAYSVCVTRSPAGVLVELLHDINPPLYFYCLKGWVYFLGIEAAAVRSLSAVAGVGALAVLGLWLRRLRLGSDATLWAMAFGALAPLHLYYSQEARPYALAYLFLTLAMGGFTAARRSNRWRAWTAHSLALLAALYTHNIICFFLPAFWVAAALFGIRRAGWARLAVCHALVLLLYAPWLLWVLGILGPGAAPWIETAPSARETALLIPRTLEVLGMGAKLPIMIRLVSPAGWVRALWIVLGLGILVVLLRSRRRAWRGPVGLLGIFLLVPLAGLLIDALVRQPIYVLGRYDTFVYPAYLGLVGLGLAKLQRAMARRIARPALAGALLGSLLALLAWHALSPKYKPLPANRMHHPQALRGQVLADFLGQDDRVVCLGLEGAKIEYQLLRHGLRADLLTFPLATRRHLGWFHPADALQNPAQLQSDARQIVEQMKFPTHPGARRLWVMMDPYSFRQAPPGSMENTYRRISSVLLETLKDANFCQTQDPQLLARCDKLGILVYDFQAFGK